MGARDGGPLREPEPELPKKDHEGSLESSALRGTVKEDGLELREEEPAA